MVRSQILFISARLFLLTLFSYFSALAVNSVVAAWLALPPAALQQEAGLPPPTTQPKPPLSSYAIIYTRDIFNSVKAKAPAQADTVATAVGSSALRLWGTAVGGHGRTFAILEDQSTRAQGLYREGDFIAPGITLVQVGWNRVIIERDGRRETLTLPTDTTPAQPVMAPAAGQSEGKESVRQIAQDTFQIDRREVERAMSSLNELFTQVRAVPYTPPEGGMQGFRLFAIKAESLIDRIGLKNGDIVQRVNGVEISDPSTAFTLLQDLQGHSQVRVDVLRNHQPVTLSYEIR